MLYIASSEVQVRYHFGQVIESAKKLLNVELARVIVIDQLECKHIARVKALFDAQQENALDRIDEPRLSLCLLKALENVSDFGLLFNCQKSLVVLHPWMGESLLCCHPPLYIGL